MTYALHLGPLPWRPLPVKHLFVNLVLRDTECSSSPIPFCHWDLGYVGPCGEKIPELMSLSGCGGL
jgi:hypothetical protein